MRFVAACLLAAASATVMGAPAKPSLTPAQRTATHDMLKSGDTRLSVYRSEFAGTNKATALTFDVDDIQQEVRGLKDKGIAFEHYDFEGLKANGDIFEGEGMKTAWFKDPDGNILSLIEAK